MSTENIEQEYDAATEPLITFLKATGTKLDTKSLARAAEFLSAAASKLSTLSEVHEAMSAQLERMKQRTHPSTYGDAFMMIVVRETTEKLARLEVSMTTTRN